MEEACLGRNAGRRPQSLTGASNSVPVNASVRAAIAGISDAEVAETTPFPLPVTVPATAISPDGTPVAGVSTSTSPVATVIPASVSCVTAWLEESRVTELMSAAGTCRVCPSGVSWAHAFPAHVLRPL